MRSINSTAKPAVTVLLVTAWLVLCMAWLVGMLLIAPAYEREFADFRLQVPFFTRLTLNVSRWCVTYFYVVPVLLLFALPVVAGISWYVRHRQSQRWLSRLWFLLILGMPLVVQGVMLGTLLLTHGQLMQGLGRGKP